jgi:hypothetical protein
MEQRIILEQQRQFILCLWKWHFPVPDIRPSQVWIACPWRYLWKSTSGRYDFEKQLSYLVPLVGDASSNTTTASRLQRVLQNDDVGYQARHQAVLRCRPWFDWTTPNPLTPTCTCYKRNCIPKRDNLLPVLLGVLGVLGFCHRHNGGFNPTPNHKIETLETVLKKCESLPRKSRVLLALVWPIQTSARIALSHSRWRFPGSERARNAAAASRHYCSRRCAPIAVLDFRYKSTKNAAAIDCTSGLPNAKHAVKCTGSKPGYLLRLSTSNRLELHQTDQKLN